ncbi:hypothetical protein EDS67_06530 [candidate division KSB1 bacterium]|nr:MAG: hypothetical protein EDS67_06530 [candidate division KSB1 bacterium]MBC6947159.1 hypothetical protein [candidate division KSB1 bacterium]MCE7941244.1 hypothetical protein [Chlorobi bacterium CHB1]MDL1875172.1 hypothetical protein [Cytophagia bacterium CHB2]
MQTDTNTVREKVLEEIKSLPDEKLSAVLNFIHSFQLDRQLVNIRPDHATHFAGSWRDMPEEIYNEFIGEITTRRKTAFSRRRNRETDIG